MSTPHDPAAVPVSRGVALHQQVYRHPWSARINDALATGREMTGPLRADRELPA